MHWKRGNFSVKMLIIFVVFKTNILDFLVTLHFCFLNDPISLTDKIWVDFFAERN